MRHSLYLLALGGLLTGCTNPEGTATIRTLLTDDPLQDAGVTDVNVTITEVLAHEAGDDDDDDDMDTGDTGDLDDDDDTDDDDGEWHVLVDETTTVDLMDLRDGATTVLDTAEMDEGFYTMIRFHLTRDNAIVADGTEYPLTVPSGEQTGIKIPFGHDVDPDETYELLLDFDAEESLLQTGNGEWILRPVIHVESFVEVPDDTGDTGGDSG